MKSEQFLSNLDLVINLTRALIHTVKVKNSALSKRHV